MNWQWFIELALEEDVGAGDFTSVSCLDAQARGKAVIRVKQPCVLAGVELAAAVFRFVDPDAELQFFARDGDRLEAGTEIIMLSARAQALLSAERLALNCLQRMSGVATLTRQYVDAVAGFPARILDTRKTTPLFRAAEKWAVRIGGGHNHRFGLYDMILIKDNHIDFCGGVERAIHRAQEYLQRTGNNLPIEVEARSLEEVKRILHCGGIQRILLDNLDLKQLADAVLLIGGRHETEASGGITLANVRAVAATGVDFISVGALTHSYQSIDISMKAVVS
ncbi:MAG: carboxylating nicotinate-nucleotide diphosphorylase [Chitinophagales bacterium]|nr:carboxylating nicotinate-nucleotide diphosphorylase [Chitinophagales bacterium]